MRVLSLSDLRLGHSSPLLTIYAQIQLEMLTKVGNTGREASEKKAAEIQQARKPCCTSNSSRERRSESRKGKRSEQEVRDSEEQLSRAGKCRQYGTYKPGGRGEWYGEAE